MNWQPHRLGLAWRKPGPPELAREPWLPLAEALCLPELPPDVRASVGMLDGLAAADDVLELADLVVVPWSVLDRLDAARRDLLALPPAVTCTAKLVEFGAFGLPRYRLEARLTLLGDKAPPEGYLLEHGAIVRGTTVEGVVSAEVVRALGLVDMLNGTATATVKADAIWQLHTVVTELGWSLPGSFLTMVQVDRWAVDVDVDSTGGLDAQLKFPQVPLSGSDPAAVSARSAATGTTTERAGQSFVRVRVSPGAAKAARTHAKTRYVGSAVPRIAQDPIAAFGDVADVVDLSEFSARVKGLIPAIYRARPYIRYEATGTDWFDVGFGVDLEPEEAAEPRSPGSGSRRLDAADWEAVVRQAIANGDRFVLFRGQWVELSDPEQELRRIEEIKARCPHGRVRRSDLAELRRILQIHDNIDELDYEESCEAQPTALPNVDVPDWFAIPLKEHQHLGLRWLHAHYALNSGAILADEMGVGKTAQLLALFAVAHQAGPSLVVAPAAVVAQWPDEAHRFAPRLTVRTVERASDFSHAEVQQAAVWVVSYETLRRGQEEFAKAQWNILACDEAQRVKNKTAQTTHVVKALKARFRVAISGTPVENGLGELWNLFDFVRPALLGSYRDFSERFEQPIVKGPASDLARAKLTQVTKPFILRRLKSQHLPGLPPLVPHVHDLPCTEVQRRRIFAKVAELRGKGAPGQFFAYAHWVQRCLFDEALVGGDPSELSFKLACTVDLVAGAWANGERTIVVAEQLDVQARISAALQARFGTAPYVINGDTHTAKRLAQVKAFADHPCPALVLSPKAGGVGLNIAAANHVILPTRMFNPAPEDQAIARAHRMGQDRPVHVHVLICTGSPPTFDQKLHALLERKRQLATDTLYPIEKLGISEEELAAAMREGAG